MSILLDQSQKVFSQEGKYYSYAGQTIELLENHAEMVQQQKYTVFGQITYQSHIYVLITPIQPLQIPVQITSYQILPTPPFLLKNALKTVKNLLFLHPNPPKQFFGKTTFLKQFPATIMLKTQNSTSYFVSELQTRFRRGILNGATVNTIQVEIKNFSLLRGSIPLIFEQNLSVRFTPKIEINEVQPTNYFDSEKITPISLLSNFGDQKILNEIYKFNYPKLVKIDLHKASQEEIRQFVHQFVKDNVKIEYQGKIPRINCLDCIDRTGVLQAVFFEELGVSRVESFRMNWVFAKLYVGTGSQKVIQHLTGKKLKIDKIIDGYLGLVRYFKNRWIQGYTQGLYDILNENETVNIQQEISKSLLFVGVLVCLLAVIMKQSLLMGIIFSVFIWNIIF